ncbi:MAG: hypothetical protein AAGH76_17300 [Pseudomonadota bacterium]
MRALLKTTLVMGLMMSGALAEEMSDTELNAVLRQFADPIRPVANNAHRLRVVERLNNESLSPRDSAETREAILARAFRCLIAKIRRGLNGETDEQAVSAYLDALQADRARVNRHYSVCVDHSVEAELDRSSTAFSDGTPEAICGRLSIVVEEIMEQRQQMTPELTIIEHAQGRARDIDRHYGFEDREEMIKKLNPALVALVINAYLEPRLTNTGDIQAAARRLSECFLHNCL